MALSQADFVLVSLATKELNRQLTALNKQLERMNEAQKRTAETLEGIRDDLRPLVEMQSNPTVIIKGVTPESEY